MFDLAFVNDKMGALKFEENIFLITPHSTNYVLLFKLGINNIHAKLFESINLQKRNIGSNKFSYGTTEL